MIVTADRVDRLVLLEWQEDSPPPALDLTPPGLPPSAILVVRRVSVVAAPAAVPGAVVAEVADAARRASRPVRGVVDTEADAVVFADDAELVACYLVALRTGRLGGWVWSRLAGSLPAPSVDAVVGGPAAPLTGVVALLHEWGRAEEVLAGVSGGGRTALLDSVATQHDLWVRPATGSVPEGPRVPVGAAPSDVHRRAATTGPTAYDVGRRGSTRALARVVADDGFVRSLVALVEQLLGRPSSPVLTSSATPSAPSRTPVVGMSWDSPRGRAPDSRGAIDDAPCAGVSGRTTSDAPDGSRRQSPRGSSDAPSATVARSHGAMPAGEGPPQALDPGPVGVATALAGVFYLVDPYRRLDLGAHGLADTAPWDVVDGLARASLAGSDVRVDDPVWLELQALSGRSPGEPPAPDVLERCAGALEVVLADLALEPEEPVVADLVAVPGRLVVDRTHVEVLIELDAVEIAVRRRALDADPGWVPSLGRVVRFHFVDGGG